MSEMTVLLGIEVGAGPGADREEMAQLSLELRSDLLELDVDAVDGVAGVPVPRGAKGSASQSIGAMVVTLSNSTVAAALANVLRSWVSRGSGRSVRLQFGEDSIEVTQISAQHQAMLIESWLHKHASR